MSSRVAIDRVCGRLGCSTLIEGKTDQEVYQLWTQYIGVHCSLIHLRIHLASILPQASIDSVLSHKEQRDLWKTLTTWRARFK